MSIVAAEYDSQERMFTSFDVCRLASVTYRQLDYWTRTGRINPTAYNVGSGYHRQWTFDEIFVVRVIGRLREAHIDFPIIDSVIATLREVPGIARIEAHTADPAIDININVTQIRNELAEQMSC